jgi:hypothetical protein
MDLPGRQGSVVHNQEGFQSSPAVVDGTITSAAATLTSRARRRDGPQEVGLSTSKSWVIGTPAVRDGVVYVRTSDARFMALDAKTGRLRFNVDVKAYVFSSRSQGPGLRGRPQRETHAIDIQAGRSPGFRTEASKADAPEILGPTALTPGGRSGSDLRRLPGHVRRLRYLSIWAILSSPAVDRGVVFIGQHGRQPLPRRPGRVRSPARTSPCTSSIPCRR